ncbi:hypothetical protein MMC30_006595 [Trapelia coarctata]|nr:hypothetical protein [Trapelia coarctata]
MNLPPCTITVNYALPGVKNQGICVPPPIETLERCRLRVGASNKRQLESVVEVLRLFTHLKALNLEFILLFDDHQPIGDAQIGKGLETGLSEIFVRLKSLSLSGFLLCKDWVSHPWTGFMESLDLARLEALCARDSFAHLWHNPSLVNLKELRGVCMASPETSDEDSPAFKKFIGRNKSLRVLEVRGIEHGDLSWLSPLADLHTLDLQKDCKSMSLFREPPTHSMSREDFALIARLLPQLRHLSLDVYMEGRWPYNKLKEIADALPSLRHLTLRAMHVIYLNSAEKRRWPMLRLISRAWVYYWRTLQESPEDAVLSAHKPNRLSCSSPAIEMLTCVDIPSVTMERKSRQIGAVISDNLEKARAGEATVLLMDVEDALGDLCENGNGPYVLESSARSSDGALWREIGDKKERLWDEKAIDERGFTRSQRSTSRVPGGLALCRDRRAPKKLHDVLRSMLGSSRVITPEGGEDQYRNAEDTDDDEYFHEDVWSDEESGGAGAQDGEA